MRTGQIAFLNNPLVPDPGQTNAAFPCGLNGPPQRNSPNPPLVAAPIPGRGHVQSVAVQHNLVLNMSGNEEATDGSRVAQGWVYSAQVPGTATTALGGLRAAFREAFGDA